MAERIPARGGFWRDTWRRLHRRPKFIGAALLIAFIVVVAMFPALFTTVDPTYADPGQSLLPASRAHWFGTDLQGHDVYARTVYGARASVTVGLGPPRSCSSWAVRWARWPASTAAGSTR